jgi:hypothetical protein
MTHKFLVKDRIINSSRDAIRSEDPTYKGQVAAGGAVAYALMDLAQAVEAHTEMARPKPELDPMWKLRLRYRRDQILNKLTAKL